MHRYTSVNILGREQLLEFRLKRAPSHVFSGMNYPILNLTTDRDIKSFWVPFNRAITSSIHNLDEMLQIQRPIRNGEAQEEKNSVIAEFGMLSAGYTFSGPVLVLGSIIVILFEFIYSLFFGSLLFLKCR